MPPQKAEARKAPPLLPIKKKRGVPLEQETPCNVDQSSPTLMNPNVTMFENGGATSRAKDLNAQLTFQQPVVQTLVPAMPAQMVPKAVSPVVYRPRRPPVQFCSPVASVYEISPACSVASPYSTPGAVVDYSPPAALALMAATPNLQVQQYQQAHPAGVPLQQQQPQLMAAAAAPPAQLLPGLHPQTAMAPAYPAVGQGAAQVQLPASGPVFYRAVGCTQQPVQLCRAG